MNADSSAVPVLERERIFAKVYPATIFLSAFLLFLVEPMIAKMILPWFGGSAAVWATCLVFFQSALLVGYYYADRTSRSLSPKQQTQTHIVLLGLCLCFLPLLPSARWRPQAGDDPVWGILRLLAATLGLPFVILSATSPLLQVWFKRVQPGADPYRLFSLSNLASFLALLSYPFLIEPRLSTSAQSTLWSALFAIFVVLCGAAAFLGRNAVSGLVAPARRPQTAPFPRQLHWLALSACGSMLLLTITNYLTQNITPVPLLWVLPLSLYLLSFALVFSRRRFYKRWLYLRLLIVFLGAMGYAVFDPRGIGALQISLPLFSIGLFICCMFCHGELNRLKPDAETLTSFYLMLSVGGAAGAVFVGVVAPRLFPNLYEFPLTLLFTGLLALVTLWTEGWVWRAVWSAASVALLFVLVSAIQGLHDESILMARNFYGALRVTESNAPGKGPVRTLYHGTIRHGSQFRELPWRKVPITYYDYASGIGLALQHCCQGPRRVGVIGLGTGTIAAYGKPGDLFHFYDINPEVVRIANSTFTYLQDSPAKKVITLGDARLSLASEPPQEFDVLAVDAFSGDAIPVHLLTREAMEVYFRHLKPNGILAIHTSNTFLVLNGLVKKLAEQFDYPAKRVESDDIESLYVTSSDWVLVSRNGRFMSSSALRKNEEPIKIPAGLRPWTDDHNNLFQLLRPLRIAGKERE